MGRCKNGASNDYRPGIGAYLAQPRFVGQAEPPWGDTKMALQTTTGPAISPPDGKAMAARDHGGALAPTLAGCGWRLRDGQRISDGARLSMSSKLWFSPAMAQMKV
jgi:hypothetical protein